MDLSRISYNPETGEFIWIRPASNRVKAGDVAGATMANGYIVITIDGVKVLAHRLAWLVHYGEWPKQCVDHINGDKKDNRIANLRDISHKANSRHQLRPSKNNSLGFLGVCQRYGRYKAEITVNRKHVNLGMFDTPEKASAAYQAAKQRLHHPEAV